MSAQFSVSVLHWARALAIFAIGAPLLTGGIGMLLFGRDADDVRKLAPSERERHTLKAGEPFEIRLNEPVE